MTEEMRAVATLLVSEKDFAAVRRIVPPRCAALKSSFYQRQNFYWDSESSPISNSGDSMGSGQRAMKIPYSCSRHADNDSFYRYNHAGTHRRLVSDFSSSEHPASKCSRFEMICAS